MCVALAHHFVVRTHDGAQIGVSLRHLSVRKFELVAREPELLDLNSRVCRSASPKARIISVLVRSLIALSYVRLVDGPLSGSANVPHERSTPPQGLLACGRSSG
jgi:hypothetical protein